MFPQHSTFLLIIIWHYSTPDPPDPFIHLSPACISHSIPLPCLLLQATLVTLHHHIFRTPPLLLHLVTLWKFPYLDFAAIPQILHIIKAIPHLPWHTTQFQHLGLGYCLFDIDYLIQFSRIGAYPITSSWTQSDRCLHLQANIHCQPPAFTFSLPQHLLAIAINLFITSSTTTVHSQHGFHHWIYPLSSYSFKSRFATSQFQEGS